MDRHQTRDIDHLTHPTLKKLNNYRLTHTYLINLYFVEKLLPLSEWESNGKILRLPIGISVRQWIPLKGLRNPMSEKWSDQSWSKSSWRILTVYDSGIKQMTQHVVSNTRDFETPTVNFASNKIRFYSITIKCNTITLYLTRLILNSQLSILNKKN